MPDENKIKVMLSSSVYGNEHVIEQIFSVLDGYGYKVLCSHKGTIYNIPGASPEESCLAAVEECDFFFGIIFPYYGTSGITHQEIHKAVELNKPRGFLAHSNVAFARTLLKDFMFDKDGNRTNFDLIKKTTVMDTLKVIDMYNDAIGHGKPLSGRLWTHHYNKYEIDGANFVHSQFGDPQRLANDLKKLKDGK